MKAALLSITTIGFLVCSGCVIMPIPTPEYSTGHTRENIDEKGFAQIQSQLTTKEEVLLTLGEPDIISRDEKIFVYWQETYQGMVVMASFGGGGGELPILSHVYLFLIEFDERDIVKRTDFKRRTRLGAVPNRKRFLNYVEEEWGWSGEYWGSARP